MILLQTPVNLRRLHRVCATWLADLWRLRARAAPRHQFHFVYFSYRPDFDYLALSLRSLVHQVREIAAIHVFVDAKDPFTPAQRLALQQIWPALHFDVVEGFSWASVETTLAEIRSFMKVAGQAADGDYLVKTDSDILFLSGEKFTRIAAHDHAAVGDSSHVGYQYLQGGLYMLRMDVVRRCLAGVDGDDLQRVAAHWGGRLGEDVAISGLLREAGVPWVATRLMLFPSEYRRIHRVSRWLRRDFVALHFVKDKQRMPDYFRDPVWGIGD